MTKRKKREKLKSVSPVIADLKIFLASQKISQAEFARRISVSPATISLFLKGIYPGNNDKLTKEIVTEMGPTSNLQGRCKRYVSVYLGGECAEYSSIIEEIQENIIHPSRNKNPKERAAFLQKLADEKLDYIGRVARDLRRLK